MRARAIRAYIIHAAARTSQNAEANYTWANSRSGQTTLRKQYERTLKGEESLEEIY